MEGKGKDKTVNKQEFCGSKFQTGNAGQEGIFGGYFWRVSGKWRRK